MNLISNVSCEILTMNMESRVLPHVTNKQPFKTIFWVKLFYQLTNSVETIQTQSFQDHHTLPE